MDDFTAPVFGALLVAISGPALAYASITGRLWVGFFPLPETFSPQCIRRSDNPRRFDWHLFGQCVCLVAGLGFLVL
ncbi:hypothetical protein [Sphingomonas aurantiaca]|uniref:hypothetical protein n=1 Tax=Sphingomonas aurantiaca TaxID=185949 RepID=UPI00334E12B6